MSDVADPEEDEEFEVEEETSDADRVISVNDPTLPDFVPRQHLETWETPEGSATGVRYSGDESDLMSAGDREAFVRAAMARDAEARNG